MNKALDRIVIDEKTLTKIRDWNLNNNNLDGKDGKYFTSKIGHLYLTKEAINREFPLTQGILEFKHDDENKKVIEFYEFKIIKNTIKGSFYLDNDKNVKGTVSEYVYNFETNEFSEFSCSLIKPGDTSPKSLKLFEDIKNDVSQFCLSTIFTLIFIAEFREDTEVITETRINFINSNSQNKSKNKKKKPLKIGIYHINPNFQVSIEKRKFERHTEAWGVRGHWRNYKKSGKRVWVKEHDKGQGVKEGKTYLI